MDTARAIDRIRGSFPFEGYIDRESGTYEDTGETARALLPAGGSVLEFGSGPCDRIAVLSALDLKCAAFDDLRDPWHREGDNRERIRRFAQEVGVDLRVGDDITTERWELEPFDMVMIHDVLEHWHDSPRPLLNELLSRVRDGGYLFVTIPNAANLRKRLNILRGHTNYPPYEQYFWSERWRGHIREYVRDDLEQLCRHLGLNVRRLEGRNHMLRNLPAKMRPLYEQSSRLFPGARDTWLLVAEKPPGWQPKVLTDAELRSLALIGTPFG